MTMMIFSFIITVNIHFNWNSDVTVAVAVVVMVLFGSSWLDYCDVIILCGCGCRGGMKWTGTVDWSTRSCPVWQRCACARRPPAPAHALCGASWTRSRNDPGTTSPESASPRWSRRRSLWRPARAKQQTNKQTNKHKHIDINKHRNQRISKQPQKPNSQTTTAKWANKQIENRLRRNFKCNLLLLSFFGRFSDAGFSRERSHENILNRKKNLFWKKNVSISWLGFDTLERQRCKYVTWMEEPESESGTLCPKSQRFEQSKCGPTPFNILCVV